MKTFGKLNLTHKFGLLFGILLLGFTIIGYMYTEIRRVSDYSSTKMSDIREAGNLVNQVDISVLQARRNEKDFILRNDLQYVTSNKENVAASLAALEKLLFLEGENESVRNTISRLKNDINDYHNTFVEMVELQTKLGLDEKSGLLGNLRNAVHEVETKLEEADQVELSASMLMMRRHEKDFLARKSSKYVEKMMDEKQNFSTLLEYSSLSQEFKDNITALMTQYHNDFLSMVDGSKKTDTKVEAFREAVHQVDPALKELHGYIDELAGNVAANVKNQENRINIVFTGTLTSVCILVLISFLLLSRNVRHSTARTMNLTRVMESGDLTSEIRIDSQDEFGQQLITLQSMQDKLKDVIVGIKDSSNEVGIAAEQVSQGNANLSQRTQEQASSLEEIASSMEEMTSTVNQNAENARQASQLASAARDKAEKGGEVANQAITAMNDINDSSKQIVDIVGLIDEIAFQTNLLALNAAVEAARAGEQGRGFAVVASEVRNLAARCTTAAKEIKVLIEDSVTKIRGGTTLVDESGKTLQEIVSAVKKVSDIVAEIAMASEEQSQGIIQVNNAVTQLDEVTQQNAALVEEAASASESMSAMAEELNNSVAFFRVDAGSEAIRYTHKRLGVDHDHSDEPARGNGIGNGSAHGGTNGKEQKKGSNGIGAYLARGKNSNGGYRGTVSTLLPQLSAEGTSLDSDWHEF